MTSEEVPVGKQNTIEVDLEIGGRKVRTVIDTESPITLIPKKLAKKLKLGNKKPVPKDREFVDLNDNSEHGN